MWNVGVQRKAQALGIPHCSLGCLVTHQCVRGLRDLITHCAWDRVVVSMGEHRRMALKIINWDGRTRQSTNSGQLKRHSHSLCSGIVPSLLAFAPAPRSFVTRTDLRT
jgi:hypothetical protein